MDRVYVMQLVRSFQVGEISRRTFLRRAGAVVGVSSAALLVAACQPVVGTPRPVTEATPTGEGVGSPGQSLTTEAGLTAGMVEYQGPDGETLTGYLARPAGERPAAGRNRPPGMVGAERAYQGRDAALRKCGLHRPGA